MPIELKITGNHTTDIAAEIGLLAQIFGVGGTAPAGNVAGATSGPVASTASAPSTSQPAASTAAPATGGKTEAPKTLDRKAQDEAVKEMIAAGAKDARFDMLTKGRQQEIEKALDKPAETIVTAANSDADLDDMFGDDSAPAATVTREQVSALMAKIGKDKDGNPIQPRLLKIREILVDHIPEGEDIKVKSLPEDKLATVYALIQKVGE